MYDMNDLVPVVAMLTKKYTGIDSSSVTYEKANQLMEAVVYCINEVQNGGEGILAGRQQSAMQAYRWCAERRRSCLSFTNAGKAGFARMGMYILRISCRRGFRLFFEHMTKCLRRRIRS